LAEAYAVMLQGFIRANKRASEWIERHLLPHRFTRSLLYLHELRAAELMNGYASPVVLDIGGGHLSPFARHRSETLGAKIFGIDILESQVRDNRMVDGGIVADVCRSIPVRDNSVDLLVTRSVLEHLPDNHRMIADVARVLRPGGCCIHDFPCKFSPFAILNTVIPKRWSLYLLDRIFPEWQGEVGFKTYYRDCYFPAMLRRHREAGLEVVATELRFYQSVYYEFFLPLYLLGVAFDLLTYSLGIKRLSSQMLLVCRKPAAAGSAGPREAVAHAIPRDSDPFMQRM
jgi:SAM-dependent methyltransferase